MKTMQRAMLVAVMTMATGWWLAEARGDGTNPPASAGSSPRFTIQPDTNCGMNLLKNPDFEFHAFEPHRTGAARSFSSHQVAFWNMDHWGDITVMRASHMESGVRPDFAAPNLVSIAPGKKFGQFFTLAEVGLAHGELVSLWAYGHQKTAHALKARIRLMSVDSADGEWRPKDFGMTDARTFNRHGRGELGVAGVYAATSEQTGRVELKIEAAEIKGRFHEDNKSHSDDINTIGLWVEFENTDTHHEVWVAEPCLVRGGQARSRVPSQRDMVPYYRYIPRTIQKLWKGEPIHILVMGSSIDRGSANPPPYLYDENPDSPTFKTPLAQGAFLPEKVHRPDLAGYIGGWEYYWNYSGRLRLELMRSFNLPVSNLLLNVEAIDGSCIAESHSALADYCALTLPPGPANGHPAGRSWRELYPGLFERREGPRPDLVIFGSGANEHYDTPDEVAIFEGAIRWIQRHYPETEFLFSMWGDSTSSPSDMQALALRYQIPFLDFGEAYDETRRWCNPLETVGHPEAWVHDLWFKTISQAFQCWDPIQPGQAQLQLPERVHPNTYGWEGDIATFSMPNPQWKGNVVTFSNSNPRLHDGTQMIIEDTAFNQWAWSTNFTPIATRVDGVHVIGRGTGFSERAIRNSTLAWGRLPLGDRHIVEVVKSPGMSIIAVDCKVCPNRRWIGVESPLWRQNSPPLKSVPFESLWGAPYGSNQVVVSPGTAVEIDGMATDVSVAFVDTRKGGSIRVFVDGVERFKEAANRPFVDAQAQEHYIENRKGIRGLPYGLHTVRVEAVERPVPLLGLFLYDARSNRAHERRLTGLAAPGETLVFSAPFQARPLVLCTAPLAVNNTSEIRADRVTFAGTGPGAYEIVGE